MSFQYACFISYRHSAKEKTVRFIEQFVDALENSLDQRLGQGVYIDRKRLKAGYKFNIAIAGALRQSICMVAILSPEYYQSEYCRREYAAMERIESKRRAALGIPPPDKGLVLPLLVWGTEEEVPQAIRSKLHYVKMPFGLINRHYPTSPVLRASPPPHLARPVPRGLPVGLALDHVMGLPVLRLSSSSTHAVTITPAEPQAAFRSHSPVTSAFPVASPGRLPHHPFRGLLSVHSHYGLRGRQVPYRTLYTRGFSRFVTSTTAPVATGRSESCRAGFAPAGKQRLCTAHEASRATIASRGRTHACSHPPGRPVARMTADAEQSGFG